MANRIGAVGIITAAVVIALGIAGGNALTEWLKARR
jgi:hypothetical protein